MHKSVLRLLRNKKQIPQFDWTTAAALIPRAFNDFHSFVSFSLLAPLRIMLNINYKKLTYNHTLCNAFNAWEKFYFASFTFLLIFMIAWKMHASHDEKLCSRDVIKNLNWNLLPVNGSSWCAKCTTMKLSCRRRRPTTMWNRWPVAIHSMIVFPGSAWSVGLLSTWAICSIRFRWFTRWRLLMNVEMSEDISESHCNQYWWVIFKLHHYQNSIDLGSLF